MKIAMIGHKRVPSREGGIEVVVTELSTRMAALGHQVDCFNRWEPSVQTDMKRVDSFEGVRLLRVRTSKRDSLNAILYAVSSAFRAVLGHYDIVHLHAEGPAAMAPLLHLFKVPTVVTIHGLDWQRAKWGGFATRFLRFGERMAARYADELVVLTDSAAQYFQKTYRRESLMIPNGIRVKPSIPPNEITRLWGLDRGGYILFLARIVPEKGLHYLLDAFRGLQTDRRLVIAGKLNRESDYVASICEKASGDERIVMTDFVQGAVLDELLFNASLYVLPSDVEGLSISLLEALSCGQRCLVSDIPENQAAAGEYARYFRHGDVESLRSELEAMLSAQTDDEAAKRRIAYVKQRFDWDVVTQSTLDAYVSAINGRKMPGAQSHSHTKAE